uniref:Glycoside hydrolase family 28 n=1 Tax=Ramulus artemis TaxID=1390046 RepID=A0A191XT38_9NEOP|nr:glycoside hydrolase family 28 [Ramulus artemis]
MQKLKVFSAAFVVFSLLHIGAAKDLRTVTEPKNPEICTSLNATSDDDTQTIQKALDSCTKGQAVALLSNSTFYAGPLTIPSGVSLLVEEHAILRAIPNPKLYDKGANKCGTYDDYGGECKAFISILKANGSGIYGKGTIDGQGGAYINSQNVTWWEVSSAARQHDKVPNNPPIIQINNSVDITLYQIVLRNAPLDHINSRKTTGLTVWKVTIYTPKASSSTDGIDMDGNQNVTIAHTKITTTSYTIVIRASEAPSRHISAYNLHLNRAYGTAIGTNTKHGVSNVNFSNITMTILTYGINIVTNSLNGGLVANISYNNICMYRVRHPVHLDMFSPNITGNLKPQFMNIFLNKVQVGNSGDFVFHGIEKSNPIEVELHNTRVSKGSSWSVKNAIVTGDWKDDLNGRTHCPHNVNNLLE